MLVKEDTGQLTRKELKWNYVAMTMNTIYNVLLITDRGYRGGERIGGKVNKWNKSDRELNNTWAAMWGL